MTAGAEPVLAIIAGPNGSGKTTLTRVALRHAWFSGCTYVNADDIARHEFGDWNSSEAILKAAQREDEIRETCLLQRQSFAFETVFSTPSRLDFIKRAKQAGFFVRLFFVGTQDPAINMGNTRSTRQRATRPLRFASCRHTLRPVAGVVQW